MEFSSTYGRPIQGVSSQPTKTRHEGQCTTQVNCVPSVVDGLKTRVASKLRAVLNKTPNDASFVHFYKRDETESYVILLDGSGIPLVYDLNGKKAVVEHTGSLNYITQGKVHAHERFTLSTIGDYTFITNREINVLPSTVLTTKSVEYAVVVVGYCTFGRTYTVSVDGVEKAKYKAPSGASDADREKVDTVYVTKELVKQLNTHTELQVTRQKNYITIRKVTGDYAFKIETTDGAKNEDVYAVKDVVDKIDKIPAIAPTGMVVKVSPTGGTDDNEFYLIASNTAGIEKSTWKETSAAGIVSGFDLTTMPHVLYRDRIVGGTVYFKFEQGAWENRTIGNDDTNPLPSFIDKVDPKPITSLGLFQNRLFVTSGENLITSRTDSYYDFFRFTTQKAVDTDPIDVFSDSKSINTIKSSSIINGDLMLFSDNNQFILSGQKPQTKKTATLQIINSYECNAAVEPATSGESIFFPYRYGKYGGIRELTTNDITGTKTARSITAHVDNYIKGYITKMASNTNTNSMFVLSSEDRHTMYGYNWQWQGNEKVQSAWYSWTFPKDTYILSADYIGDKLYVVSSASGATLLEEYDMSEPPEYGLSFNIKMDRRYDLLFSYDTASMSWKSNAAMKYKPTDLKDIEIVLVDADNPLGNGVTVPVTIGSDNKLTTNFTLSTDLTRTVTCVVGELFDVEYEPTKALLRDYQGKVSSLDKPILGVLYFNFDKVGHFTVEVENTYGDIVKYDHNNRRMNAVNNIVGFAPLIEFTQEIPVRQNTEEVVFRLKTRTHIEMQLREIEWTGSSNPSKRRR